MNSISLNSRLLVVTGILLGLLAMLGAAGYFTGSRLYDRFTAPDPVNRAASPNSGAASGGAMDGPAMVAENGLNPEQAETLMRLMQEIQTNPNNTDALVEIAELFIETGNLPMAQGFLQRAVMGKPGDTYPRYALGLLLFKEGQTAQAAAVFEGLLEIREEPAAMYNLALLYKYHLNKQAQAQELLRKALAMPDLGEDLSQRLRAEQQP